MPGNLDPRTLPDTAGHPMMTTGSLLSFVLDVQASRKWLDNPPRVDLLSILSVKHELRQTTLISSSELWLKDCGSGSLVVPGPSRLRNGGNEQFEQFEMSIWTAQSSDQGDCHLMHHPIKVRPIGNQSKELGGISPQMAGERGEVSLSSHHNEQLTNNHINPHQSPDCRKCVLTPVNIFLIYSAQRESSWGDPITEG